MGEWVARAWERGRRRTPLAGAIRRLPCGRGADRRGRARREQGGGGSDGPAAAGTPRVRGGGLCPR
eukprot:854599-Pyramimonas_sp.AAC.2